MNMPHRTFVRTSILTHVIVSLTLVSLALMIIAAVSLHSKPTRVVVPSDPQLWQSSMEMLQSQIGVKEATGRNDGPVVRAYLRSVALGEGYPWCQAVQYWAFARTADSLGIARFPCIPITRTASTAVAFRHARAMGHATHSISPQQGDLMYWFMPNKVQGHVERVRRVLRPWAVETIGGNTSNGKAGSQREGNGVYVRVRVWAHPLARMMFAGFVGYYAKEC